VPAIPDGVAGVSVLWWTFTDGASHAVRTEARAAASSTVVSMCSLVEDRWRAERDPDRQGARCRPCASIVSTLGL
jgi:hypothetical protein